MGPADVTAPVDAPPDTCARCGHPHDADRCLHRTGGVPGFPSTQTVCQCPARVARVAS